MRLRFQGALAPNLQIAGSKVGKRGAKPHIFAISNNATGTFDNANPRQRRQPFADRVRANKLLSMDSALL